MVEKSSVSPRVSPLIAGLVFALAACGCLCLLAVFFWVTGALFVQFEGGSASGSFYGLAALVLAPAFLILIAAAFCFGFAANLRLLAIQARHAEAQLGALEQLRTSIQSLDVAIRIPAPPAAAAAPTSASNHHALDDTARPLLLDLLQQVRDASLMNDVQRQQLATRHWAKRKATLTESIERHMLTCDWAGARAQLDELQALLPDDPEVKELADRVGGEYEARLGEDLAAAGSQLKHLCEIAAWTEANELVAAMENKYPQNHRIDEMRNRISHERDVTERKNKERILGELADATDRKQWRRAVGAVEEFIAAYPDDSLVERLRIDLTTLQENVNAQERKEQEQQFKELLKKQRYEEALGVAKSVIARFPQSSAAGELTKLLPKVEDLIRQRQVQQQHAVVVASN